MKYLSILFAFLLILTGCGEDADVETTDEPTEEMAQEADDTGAMALVNANDASAQALAEIDVVGHDLAQAIADGAPYNDLAELDAVVAAYDDGIDRDALYARVYVPMDLNTASEQAIMLIPGVGDRMAHEFDEYRPYVDMAQFRREIGKYVDDDEVERLAMYVEIRD